MTRDGGCFCGAIRYRFTGEPLTLYACHCIDCQRQSGSAFGLSMIVLRNAVELLCGRPRHFAIVMADERRKQGTFCADCGSRLWGEPNRFPDILVLRPGTLDDTTWIRPVAHIWTSSAQPGIPLPPETLQFEHQPEDPMALINAWRERRAS